MKIGIEEALAATGVGVGDVLIKEYAGNKTFGPLNVDDLYRFGIAIGAGIVNYMGYERDFTEPIFYASLPLVVDSVANIVKKETAKTASSTAIRVVSAPAPSPVISTGVPP